MSHEVDVPNSNSNLNMAVCIPRNANTLEKSYESTCYLSLAMDQKYTRLGSLNSLWQPD